MNRSRKSECGSRNSETMPAAIIFLFVCVFSAHSSEKDGINQPVDYKKALTTINPGLMITPDEAYDWHLHKDKGGPTYSGNASWQSYMSLIKIYVDYLKSA